MEIERKFVLAVPPFDLSGCRALSLMQGYISTRPVIRLRRQDDMYILTVKGSGTLAKEEFELPLTQAQFESLWRKVEGVAISKTRYLIPLGDGLTAELDAYHGALAGRYTVEVEFPDIAAATRFTPPAWFGQEATEDARYSNASLSLHGWPEA